MQSCRTTSSSSCEQVESRSRSVRPAACRAETRWPMADKLTFDVAARRLDAHGSVASAKEATVTLDTDLAGRRDAFNPAELLLAAISACMIKGIERVAPMLRFEFRGVHVALHGVRQD